MPLYIWLPIAIVYGLALAGLMVYGFHCYYMLWLFVRRQRSARTRTKEDIDDWLSKTSEDDYPFVTLQLPIYNEREVVERLLRSTATLDYPTRYFAVQVLDDSTDSTRQLVDRLAEELREEHGLAVTILRREDRKHFKAGALAEGLKQVRGELVAIFDADFVIPPDFLKRSVALIESDRNLACVQGRWGHLNRDENWLTRAQSVGIDGHFTAEQGARSYNNLCLNFNGTAGIWRKQAILDAGGWQGDTLTEDLDLSYRCQMEGYRLRYDLDLECQAEIPNNVAALKSQQYRWAKGSIETAIKLMPRIVRSNHLSLRQKLEACVHLTHYLVAVFMCVICLLTLPMLLWTPLPQAYWVMGGLWTAIIVSAIAPCVMYTGSGMVMRRGWFSLRHFPAMLVVGTGLCLNNSLAVFAALKGKRSSFVRTPKSGSTGQQRRSGSYRAKTNWRTGFTELWLGIYCWLTLVVYVGAHKYMFGFFLAAYACGFTAFGLATLLQGRTFGRKQLLSADA